MEGTMHRMSTQLDAVWEKAEQLTSEACNISERQENFNRKFEAANKTVQVCVRICKCEGRYRSYHICCQLETCCR